MGACCVILQGLLLCLVIGYTFSINAEDGLDTRPTGPKPEKVVNIFEILTKDPAPSLGRSIADRPKIVQGDIAVRENEKFLLQSSLGRAASEANIGKSWVWPRSLWQNRIVPYVIENYTPYSSTWKTVIAAFRKIESLTCLTYRPKRSTDKNWIRVHRGSGCWSNIGRSFGHDATDVSIGCSTAPVLILHELIHALGVYHEHARPDRDNYVNVFKWNARPNDRYNFDKKDIFNMNTFGLPYDYNSIMHYSRTSFTMRGATTLEAKHDPNMQLGGNKDLSKYDIMKIKAMYHCHEKRGTKWSKWSDWSHCMTARKRCIKTKFRICLEEWKYCPEADNYGVHMIMVDCPSKAHCARKSVHGFWGQWSSWSSCTKTCDEGAKRRSRQCDSPRPTGTGWKCRGASSETQSCMRRQCRPNGMFTNFENGMGIWRDYGQKFQVNWQRARGRVNILSGPRGDHTDGRGYYLYVSSKNNQYKKATIISKVLSGTKCLSFAYIMNGRQMGVLDIFGKTTKGQWWLFKLSNKLRGHQGWDWKRARFTVGGGGSQTYWLYFEAKIGFPPYSDIAIDDILLEEGKCDERKKKPVPACVNKDKDCKMWAHLGECYFLPGYMLKNCCKACKERKKCKNEYKNVNDCREWARTGECKKNNKWMWGNCCKACKDQGQCIDKESSCKKHAKEGYCTNTDYDFDTYMWKNCCPSCAEESSKAKARAKAKAKVCVDTYTTESFSLNCEFWSNTGECKKNSKWMLKNCCKSCKGKPTR